MKRPAELDDPDRKTRRPPQPPEIDHVERMVNREVDAAQRRFMAARERTEAERQRWLNDQFRQLYDWGWDDHIPRVTRSGRSWWARHEGYVLRIGLLALAIGLAVFDYRN